MSTLLLTYFKISRYNYDDEKKIQFNGKKKTKKVCDFGIIISTYRFRQDKRSQRSSERDDS